MNNQVTEDAQPISWRVAVVVAALAAASVVYARPAHAGRRPGDAAWSIKPRSAGIQKAPKAVAYVEETDYVVTQSSVFAVTPDTQHDTAAYHGSRLTQFRYLGPTGTGGIYDAIELERNDRQLDPAKYRYHWGRSR